MPDHFEMDLTDVVAWAEQLIQKHGHAKARRIIACERPHYRGTSCICGWFDDPDPPPAACVPPD